MRNRSSLYSNRQKKLTADPHRDCCFLNFINFINMDNRHNRIITKASKKNMPPISPGVVDSENIYFKAILRINNDIKIIGKAFVVLTYKSSALTSYFVVHIITIENKRPIKTDSKI